MLPSNSEQTIIWGEIEWQILNKYSPQDKSDKAILNKHSCHDNGKKSLFLPFFPMRMCSLSNKSVLKQQRDSER